MDYKDYYKTLGVEKTASADEIKKAYRRLARKYHPDVSKEPDAAVRMSDVNEANTVLSDPEKRAAYDQLGARTHAQAGQDFRPPPNWDAGFEFSGAGPGFDGGDFDAGQFSEFFEQMFGGQARASRGGSRAGGAGGGPRRGQDHHAKIELDLVDAYEGAERNIALRSVDGERELAVRIPKGVREGQHIRLAGRGGPGHGGGEAGDLLLEVAFRPDPRWRADGRDVHQRVPVAPWEAALGAAVTVHTPSGPTEVSVPPNSRAGRKLRLKGRGIPSREPGDLYLELEIATPPATSDAQREAYERLATAFPGYDPRRG